MRRAGRKKKPLTIQPIKCVVMLSSDEENDCIAAEKKENKQLKRIMEFADNNNLIPMKVFRRGIFGRRLRDEVFYKAIRYMRAGKADALRQIVDIHPNGEFYLLVGNKVLFKKEQFEQFLAESTAI